MRRVLVIIACCGGVWAAEPAARAPLPDLPTAQVAIPWSELKGLLEALTAPAKVEEKPKEEPPVAWTIGDARYTAVVENWASAQVRAAFEIYVWKSEGWTEVPLLAPTVAPVSVQLDGDPAPLVQVGGEMRGLLLESPGSHRVEATFFVPLKAVEGVVSMEFAAAPAAINQVHLEVPVPDAVIQSPDAAGISVKKGAKSVTAELAFRRAANIAISWRLPAAGGKPATAAATATSSEAAKPSLQAPKAEAPPSVVCMVSTLASVSERVLACETTIEFSVQRGSTDRFAFTLPAAVNVLSVEGQGSAWSRVVTGGVQRVEVSVNHAVTDQYTVSAKYDVAMEETPESEAGDANDDEAKNTAGGDAVPASAAPGAQGSARGLMMMAVPELVVLNVTRQLGWVAVVARDTVELEPVMDAAGYTRVDMTELPAPLVGLAANPILLAYRQDRAGGELALLVRKLADVPVRPATIDSAAYTTLVTSEGARMTRAVYSVRNNVRQYLRVRLGEGAKVSTASVGGKLVKPARDAEEGTVLLPLLQSASHGRELDTFPVEVVYTEPAVELPGEKGTMALAAPATDLPVARATWEVWIPAHYRLYEAEGDVSATLLDGSPDTVFRARRTPRGTREQTIVRLREGVERFFITDINGPLSSSSSGGTKYVGEPIHEPGGSASVAGILPVQVDLPLEGRPYMFGRTLIDEGEPLTLRISVFSDGVVSRVLAMQRVLALVAGVAVGWAFRRRGRQALAVAVMAVALTMVAYFYGYSLGLLAWRAGIVGFGAGAFLPWVPAASCALWQRYSVAAAPRTVME